MIPDENDMHPILHERYLDFKSKSIASGINFTLTCVARQAQEQLAIYAQGRQVLAEVNHLRFLAGLPPISTKDNKVVTWTLRSKHIINWIGPASREAYSHAFDIALLVSGKVSYDLKVDVNKNQIPDYAELGQIGVKCGLVWGGRFKKPDYCHYEI